MTDRAAARLVDTGQALLASGRYAPALKLFDAARRHDPIAIGPWVYMGQCLTLDGQTDAVHRRLIPEREAVKGDGLQLFLFILAGLVARGDFAAIAGLCSAHADNDSGIGLICLFYRAALAIYRGDYTAGFADLDAFRQGIEARGDLLPVDHNEGVNTIVRHAFHVESPVTVAGLVAAGSVAPPRLLEPWPGLPDWSLAGNLPVMVVTCDGAYARRYLASLTAAFAQTSPTVTLHLHVIDPEPTLQPLIEQARTILGPDRVNVSQEFADELKSAPYYVAARFLRAPQLLDLYRRPIFLMDVDVQPRFDLAELAMAIANADVANFKLDEKLLPGSRYAGVLNGFADTAGARRVLQAMAAVIGAKIFWPAQRLWNLDQAALASSLYWLEPEIRRADIAQRTGHTMTEWFDLAIDTQAKSQMIAAANAPGRS